jgi:predicted Zn-dependent peptidase
MKRACLLAIATLLGQSACKHSQPAEGPASPPAGSKTATTAEKKSDVPAVPKDAAWRQSVPEGGPPPTPVLPKFQVATLKNGMTVIVPDQKSMLPLVSFGVITKGGAATDPAGHAGVAALTYSMLGEGAGKRDALAFSDAVADVGAQFGSAADRDRGTVFIGGLKRNGDAMLSLLADSVIRPRLLEKDFDRRKKQMVAALERNRGSPQGLAFEALPALIYGPEHAYGHPPNGTVESIAKLTLADVKKAKARMLGPRVSALVAAGDITLEEATKLAEKYFGAWSDKTPPAPTIAGLEAKPRDSVVLIQKDNAPQTMVVIGRPIFGRGHPDEAAMTVLNEIYGGAFTSRLNMNLREDKGYTYGAQSQATFRLGAGVFAAFSAIRQDATAQGLLEFFNELDGLKKKPPDDAEVGLAKAGIIRSLTGSFERTAAIATAADVIFVYGLGPDYYTKLGDKYAAVTTDAVRDAAAKYLVPELMQVLLVGDSAKIKESVVKDNLGPVVVRDHP